MGNNMEQQKIYIDIEEEITTVIEQLRHARMSNVVLVVPQHAVLLQSVVNLKLLAQEAQKLQKNIAIMTKDVDGAAFAERAGILTQPYVAEEELHQSVKQEVSENVTVQSQKQMRLHQSQYPHSQNMQQRRSQQKMQQRPQKRMQQQMQQQPLHQKTRQSPQSQIYSYTQQSQQQSQNHIRPQMQDSRMIKAEMRNDSQNMTYGNSSQKEVLVGSSMQTGNVGNDINRSISHKNMEQRNVQENVVVPQPREDIQEDRALAQYEQSLEDMYTQSMQQQSYQPKQRQVGTTMHPTQQKDSFTQHAEHVSAVQHHVPSSRALKKSRKVNKIKQKRKKESQVSGSVHFVIKGFVYAGIMLVILIFCVLVLPKTLISVTPKDMHIDENMEMTVRTDQSVYDEDRRLIPARFVERDVTFTKTFASSGSGDVKAQKAQGTIMIYNEYNEKPQILVATTRFLAEDGTLFRLVKNATVPGMKNGEPGKVEALVVADEEGVAGNIGPSRFSIPGFDSSPKKGKFYGVSEKSMNGGGAGGNGVAVVTQEDIDRAEKEMNSEVNTYIQEQIEAVLRPNSEILLEKAIKKEIVRSEASVTSGTMGEEFMYEIVAHVKAIVFAQGDILAVIQSGVDEEMEQYDVEQMELTLSFDMIEIDFDNEQMKIKVRGVADIVTIVDLKSFKEDIIGKKHDELLEIIEEEYNDKIEKITIESVVPGFPAFIANRISRLGSMTDVRIVEEAIKK
ncbi:MAG: hypothetical protein CR972_00420 [Candidatus Moraniibacteriota bacterium]|nr:MAG: hypothetical protein CR972_00420 [Candidatus Moranbacteria bacterium]